MSRKDEDFDWYVVLKESPGPNDWQEQLEKVWRDFDEALEKHAQPITWIPNQEKCLFEGLPSGAYLLYCPCWRHRVHC